MMGHSYKEGIIGPLTQRIVTGMNGVRDTMQGIMEGYKGVKETTERVNSGIVEGRFKKEIEEENYANAGEIKKVVKRLYTEKDFLRIVFGDIPE